MTFGVLRLPVTRMIVALAYTVWVVAMAVPQCHVFTHTVVPHAHIEASGPLVASPATLAASPATLAASPATLAASPATLADLHQHAAEPDRHVPADGMLAALPRAVSLLLLLLVACVSMLLAAPASVLGGGVRAPPVAAIPVCPGRDKLTRFGIDRN
ncbi:hypothetical protein [Nocardia sp. NPDC057455]|uniref:hypothetical protein n=1 Tax=Nocardia sp. NPDC057455 TaxID=3346138 RepID=UPI00366C4DF5